MIKLKSLLSENILTEAFTDKDGIVWPHFKDQKSVTALNNISLIVPDGRGIFVTIFGPDEINGKESSSHGHRLAKKRLGTDSILQFSWIYWNCVALNPNGVMLPSSMSAVVNNIFNANTILNLIKYYEVSRPIQTFPADVRTAISDPKNIEWWDTHIEYPKGTRITRWGLFSNTYLKPNYDKVKSLYVTAAPKPATPATKPGTAKAPVKP
jgi:hypothetical protein